ncbi:MAG: hypothetical protein A3I66_12070 [Burkholderiales bacterium RIFCSPLOWO2_02_FULL_57_36]|nr:MAG: hypothetical protein A3I66_12070 [Burkholderiales bacterium RIFCSPLOWO2_02_FULL_57_36]
MLSDGELAQWLQTQPLDEPVIIDGESVYLRIHPDGAELGAYLTHSYTPDQLQRALQQGFSSAIDFDAGLGQTSDGNSLVLTQWLHHVRDWSQAAMPLENLLNQLTPWRAALAAPEAVRTASVQTRAEHLLRMRFSKKK